MTLAVQSVIAYADALTLKFGNVKNVGDHAGIAQLLRSVLRKDTDERQLQRLSSMVADK
jgi:hypothetical protein